MPDVLLLTFPQLADLLEIPERTLRLYRTKGLVDPPELRGRVGYYGDEHVRQLRIVKALIARGFPLATISGLIRHGVSRTVLLLLLELVPQTDGAPPPPSTTLISQGTIDRVRASHPQTLAMLAELGMVDIDEAGRVRTDAVGLALVSDLVRHGLEIEDVTAFVSGITTVALDAAEVIDARLHPRLTEPALERALTDAATVVFREALMRRRRRRSPPRPES